MHWHKIPASQILVITDDLALPLGRVRLRAKGSDGGHNGLKSIQQEIGSTDYPRLRVGIGRNFRDGDQVRYVLSPFQKDEQEILHKVIEHCKAATLAFTQMPLEQVMTLYNKTLT
jgi:PTH1 family peptidyl-tRNA hydrolase